jgi:hypothetical protein
MSLVISKVFTYDTDAGNYIQAVEAADGQALEPATRQAINNFVIGCKQDGIWNAIKASCILAGARTLAGALVPLAGTAPTNVGGLFVSGDYNRKTGLVGNGTSKQLNSNRANNADPQNNNHNAVWLSTYTSGDQYFMGSGSNAPGDNFVLARDNAVFIRNRFDSGTESVAATGSQFSGGIFAASRTSSSNVNLAYKQSSGTIFASLNTTSSAASSNNNFIYNVRGSSVYSTCRLAFYSIGESLDLALLDTRVTALITAFGVAIP